jgi:metal-responsive CopG/Arc/MetJ family transcriptional regulator
VPTRTTIYLDETLVKRVRRFVPARGLSQLLNDLLAERLAQLEQAEIEAQMREGYIATRQERQELNADWQAVDGEGWPA